MKCRLLVEREVLEFHPETGKTFAPQCLVDQCVRRDGRLFAPAGTVIDDPDCFWIVLNGQAEPVDDECIARTEHALKNSAEMKVAAKELALGILPEDRPKFRAGEILGYNADGSYIPGPNWKPVTTEDEE